MTPRDKALLFSPPIAGLIGALAWFLLDTKGEARNRAVDHGIRALNNLRNRARF